MGQIQPTFSGHVRMRGGGRVSSSLSLLSLITINVRIVCNCFTWTSHRVEKKINFEREKFRTIVSSTIESKSDERKNYEDRRIFNCCSLLILIL